MTVVVTSSRSNNPWKQLRLHCIFGAFTQYVRCYSDPIIALVVTEATFISGGYWIRRKSYACLWGSAAFLKQSGENSPDSPGSYGPPPDTDLRDTDKKITCSECETTDYFEHDGDEENALCKYCAHQVCSACVES
ncbi:hypothetical protein F4814DRAFT_447299 [Daldinia grandis]|nr:hypothetical protein F4814DRAFT_447299 [Daldinia grandis]